MFFIDKKSRSPAGFSFVLLRCNGILHTFDKTSNSMNKSDHPNSRTVTIYRAGSMLSRAQGPEIDELSANSRQSIGSYFESPGSMKIATGLSLAEEKILMPKVINIPADDRDFRKAVNDFFTDITTMVPHQRGVELEVGLLENNEHVISEDNLPINIIDYIRYRHAKGHPWVAENHETAKGDQTKQYYIFDKYNIQHKNSKRMKDEDAAMTIYLKISKDMNIVDQMLVVMGVDPRSFVGPQKDSLKVAELRNLAKDKSEDFIKAYTEEDLELRYTIKSMLKLGVLKEVGSRIIDAETDALIGNTLEETIWWFKDDGNSDSVVVLKARMQTAMETAPLPKAGSRRTQLPAGAKK